MYTLVLVRSGTGLEMMLIVQHQGVFVIITKVTKCVQLPFVVR
jgi:hypothetical protein